MWDCIKSNIIISFFYSQLKFVKHCFEIYFNEPFSKKCFKCYDFKMSIFSSFISFFDWICFFSVFNARL